MPLIGSELFPASCGDGSQTSVFFCLSGGWGCGQKASISMYVYIPLFLYLYIYIHHTHTHINSFLSSSCFPKIDLPEEYAKGQESRKKGQRDSS